MPAMATGKIVLITGAGGGIGRAAAEIFAREGAEAIVVVDKKVDGGNETVELIEKAGARGLYLDRDVTDETAVADMIATTVATFGRLDAAMNNAGMSGIATAFEDCSLEQWNKVLGINLTAVFLCMKHELKQMTQQSTGGAIVNTSSGAGVIGFPSLPHYVASKHGVLGLTKTAAIEFVRRNIRVNAICPGSTDTPMLQGYMGDDPERRRQMESTTPTGVLAQPEWIAEAAVWLCSPHASFVNGEAMLVDGGQVCR